MYPTGNGVFADVETSVVAQNPPVVIVDEVDDVLVDVEQPVLHPVLQPELQLLQLLLPQSPHPELQSLLHSVRS